MATPKKIYMSRVVSSSCRLCGNFTNNSHLLRIFSIYGKQKDLNVKIKCTTGLDIQENDVLPKVVCRKCEAFVNKMWIFRHSCNQNQIKFRKKISVKRQHFSPSSKENAPKCNTPNQSGTSPRKKLSFLTPLETSIVNVNVNVKNNNPEQQRFISVHHIQLKQISVKSVYTKKYDELVTKPLTPSELHKIENAVRTAQPLAIVSAIASCETTELAMKKVILDKVAASCKELCKRKGGSVLLDNTYNGIAQFNWETIWEEMFDKHDLLIDIFNTVTGNMGESTAPKLKMKYVNIYSILMNERWHEFSLVQRVNTLLMIEGGCSKQVII